MSRTVGLAGRAAKLIVRVVSTTTKRQYYRNGQLREEVPLRNGRRHGVVRTWHKNGLLASEEPYEDDLPHGVCRQWDENGNLLGEYQMEHGTGIQRVWHDNGQLQLETSTVDGEFCGPSRMWLRDGTLISQEFRIHGRTVSAGQYRQMSAKDRTLPRCVGRAGKPLRPEIARQKRIMRVFTSWLMEKPNHSEAREWLGKHSHNRTARKLGRFKRKIQAAKFVEELYRAGASEVIVPDIYRSKAGDQFADGLLIKLPRDKKKRRAVRAVCARLQKQHLGAFEPDHDIGESHLFISMT
jgi:hypothetical protein